MMLDSSGESTISQGSTQTSVSPQKDRYSISDKSLFSKEFMEEFEALEFSKNTEIIADKVISQGITTPFPSDLNLNEPYRFVAKVGDHFYKLLVIRVNLSTLEFEFEHKVFSKLVHTETGVANLSPAFFLQDELDNDNENGLAYTSHEYRKKTKECWIHIRIGEGRDEKGRYRAIIEQGCGKNTDYHRIPEGLTLRTELEDVEYMNEQNTATTAKEN
ncbi:MAG: hypothetical protein CFE21_02825 [Bacteroidetes bacterium B1(2017)]|nr:MAG: hypothetical protein CFE21_02825 [Bacteroidetes bacterium B1(2017)]